ncbi:hypothetical protein LNP25_16320 [Klebsiella variicola subsp. variicola]|nr:hypothetical protein [Klebsiella variicola subsp. variicola]
MNTYQQREALTVDYKGDDLQDVVSVADKRVEAFVKQRIQSAFPQDGFSAKRAAPACPTPGSCGWSDPIDGTSCFLNGLHTGACRWRSSPTANRSSAWSMTPTIASCFTPCGPWRLAQRRPDPSTPATTVKEGVMGVGTSHRVTPADFLPFLGAAQRRRHVYPQRFRGVR